MLRRVLLAVVALAGLAGAVGLTAGMTAQPAAACPTQTS